jgi:hypothetical protein
MRPDCFPRSRWLILPVMLIPCLLGSCGTGGSAAVQPAAPTPAEPSPTAPPAISAQHPEIWAAWETGPHAAPYDLGKGPNTYCSRCHSPHNWDPAARVDPAPSCVSCKFPFEAEPRIAVSNPLIPEEEWAGIDCAACHLVTGGMVQADLRWFNPQSGYAETLASSTALCEKCHRDTETLRHARTPQGDLHAEYTCTSCHEPHTAQASCSTAACHPDVTTARQGAAPAPHPGHDPAHASVSCGACHDASGAQIALDPETGEWHTLRTVEVLGRASASAFQSHSLAREVDCARCHFGGNPWGLPELLEGSRP